jgi:hypothetical protein
MHVTDFEEIANNFITKWNFPNCMTALNRKNIRIFCSTNCGLVYFNYKHYFYIVLLILADANLSRLMLALMLLWQRKRQLYF